MAYKCSKCGAHGDPNPKGALGFVLLRGCGKCTDIKIPKFCQKCGHGPCVCRMGDRKLGSALREIRLAKGYTLRYVESKGIVSNPYLSQLETGKIKDIGFKKLVKLCDFYDIDIKYFEQFVYIK